MNGLRRRWRLAALGDEAAARATCQFQRVGQNVCNGFRLRACNGDVDQRRDDSDQRPVQNETRLDSPAHPERSEEARDEGSGGSRVVQEIFAEA